MNLRIFCKHIRTKEMSLKITLDDVRNIYQMPLLDLVFRAAEVHREYHDPHEVQMCTLLSIKTGGCPEDCKYCSQSIFNNANLEKEILMKTEAVLEEAKKAKDAGSTRFCMGAGWRNVNDGRAFDRVLEMVKGVSDMGMEACVTLGMLTEDQAMRLKEAGLSAYNHNLDTSEDYYDKIITTRTYQDRLDTIANVAKAGISVCCGGILGLGESEEDRISLLHTLCNLSPQPESVPINALVPVAGTPLENTPPLDSFEWIRTIATARILMPQSMVRLSAGRLDLSKETQAFAFLAGANAIFTGEKLLTTPNPEHDADAILMQSLGLKARPSFKDEHQNDNQEKTCHSTTSSEKKQGCGSQGCGSKQGCGG
jgi:biotin synthase